MINLIKKYLNFIFKFNLSCKDKTYKSYNEDVNFNLNCRMDPLFFLKHCFDDNDIIKKTKLKFNSSQLYFIDSFINKQKLITVCKNYSECEDAQILIVLWLLIFHQGYKIGIITPTISEAHRYMKSLILLIKRIKPEYKIKLIESTAQSITLDNFSHCSVRSSRENDIDGYFRGITLNTLFLNEASRIKHVKDVYNHHTTVYELDNILISDVEHNLDSNKDSVTWFFDLYKNSKLYDIEMK